mgnify:CR=1 FL=1
MITLKVGDLLIRERDKRPCLVVEVAQTPDKEWGQGDTYRRQYRLFDGVAGVHKWYPDTVIRATFIVHAS